MEHLYTNPGYNVHFKNKALWDNYNDEQIKAKCAYILAKIPKDVKSIIDVGCGNGSITNELAEKYRLLGVDIAQEALQYVKVNKICAPSSQISVHDQSFDMVFSSELLEHLPKDILYKTVKEFERVAKKYIMITIPNNESLKKRYVKCPECNFIFHVDHHLSSFSEEDIKKLVGKNFKHLQTAYFGWLDREYNEVLLKIKQVIGNTWWTKDRKHIICPYCGNNKFPSGKGNIISKSCNLLNRIISRDKTKPFWMYLLFEKQI